MSKVTPNFQIQNTFQYEKHYSKIMVKQKEVFLYVYTNTSKINRSSESFKPKNMWNPHVTR